MPDTRIVNTSAGAVGAPQVSVVAGGAPAPALAMVSADQVTVLGNGTLADPLRTTATATAFNAEYVDLTAQLPARPGQPVVAVSGAPSTGVARVSLGTAGLPTPAPNVAGLIVAVLSGEEVTVRSAGLVTLSTEEWDLITGETGGLRPEFVYYLDTGFDSFGHLTRTVPASGQVRSVVGVAASRTSLLLSTPSDPVVVP